MATHVLVPVDGSESSWKAFDHALSQCDGERITVLHVVDPVEGVYTDLSGGYYDEETYDRAVERGEALGAAARNRAEPVGALDSTVLETTVETGRPARTIITYAEEHGVDHIVMGSHGRTGVSRVLLGSVAETVARRAPVPVTIVR